MMAIAPPASTRRKRELSYTDTAYAAKARARLDGSRSGLMRRIAVSMQTTTRKSTAWSAVIAGGEMVANAGDVKLCVSAVAFWLTNCLVTFLNWPLLMRLMILTAMISTART